MSQTPKETYLWSYTRAILKPFGWSPKKESVAKALHISVDNIDNDTVLRVAADSLPDIFKYNIEYVILPSLDQAKTILNLAKGFNRNTKRVNYESWRRTVSKLFKTTYIDYQHAMDLADDGWEFLNFNYDVNEQQIAIEYAINNKCSITKAIEKTKINILQ